VGLLSGLDPEAAGPFAIQAAIAAEHARAASSDETNWMRIALLYSRLLKLRPTPVVALNHAVAVAMAYGSHRGLELLAALEATRALADYYLMWSAKAELLRRMDRFDEDATAYRRALELVTSTSQRRFLERRLAQVESGAPS